jgi:putative toxin-antitoxin system antitoxin component (TIGR02293 family)
MPTRADSETWTRPAHVQSGGASEAHSLADERRGLIETALAGLAGRDREILTRFFLHEETPEQICTEMGLTDTQFRLLKSRAKARFGELGRKTATRKRPAANPAPKQRTSTVGAPANVDRIIPIVAHAVAVFGDEQKASHWLTNPLPALGNRSPVQVLTRGGDFDSVDQILTRIEHNIPS